MNSKDGLRRTHLINRRTFVSMATAGAASTLYQGATAAEPAPTARNVVLVHGLFADGYWAFLLRNDRNRGRYAFERFGPRLRGGAGS
jgi:hypothetical protein